MELSYENIETLAGYLQQTLSADVSVRKPAEQTIHFVELNKNYPLLLLHLVDNQSTDLTIRVAGAVAFKNYIKRNWKVDEDSTDRIHSEDRESVKRLIVDLMLRAPESVQKQLSNAVSIIGREDFPNKWPNLITQMVEKFGTGDFHVINGVLHTAHSLFKRYRYEFKSQELWVEIKFVNGIFDKPLTELFLATIGLAEEHKTNPDALRVIYNSLVIICKVFYSLNYQDFPEFFEDNMETWMNNFHTLLHVDIRELQTRGDDEPGLLEQLKSQVCDNVALYAQKYDEEFQPYLPNFVTAICNLLVSTGQQPKYDLLVSNALQFLASVSSRPHNQGLFQESSVLGSICEKVVIPNMEFRAADEGMFVDNPEEYIRRDIEGSDVDTRRRAACDLVKALSQYFEDKMMEIFGQYVQAMLGKYAQNNSANWRSKDAAFYLLTSLAVKGQTQKHGITQTSQLVSLPGFCTQHILPELTKDVNELPVLKADAIKYIMIFRNQLPPEMVIGSIPQLIRHLQAQNSVIHTYAACAIEKILVMRNSQGGPLVTSEDLAPLAENLLTNLLGTLNFPASQENEYVMKAIMRSFSTLQERVIPFLAAVLPKLTQKLTVVAKNPSKPHFNHYLFETLCLSVRITCKSNPSAVSSFDEAFFPIFQEILQQDVQEFIPYVLQMLSLLLELQASGVPEPYMALFPCLLAPVLWERPGNTHPLVRLLQAFIAKGASQIRQHFVQILDLIQKLVASKVNDHEGFYLMQSLIEHFPANALLPFMKQVFVELFKRLSSSKTTKFVKGLLVFLFLYAVNYGASNLIEMVDGIQQQMFGIVIEQLIIPHLQKISGTVEKKICAVGMTKLLCECSELANGKYSQYWPPLLQVLIGFLELPEDQTSLADDHYIDVEVTPGYQVAYSKLVYANKTKHDPLQNVPDARIHLIHCLHQLSGAYPFFHPLSEGLNYSECLLLNNYVRMGSMQWGQEVVRSTPLHPVPVMSDQELMEWSTIIGKISSTMIVDSTSSMSVVISESMGSDASMVTAERSEEKHAHGGLENTDAPTTLQHLQNTAPDDVVAERVSDPLVIGLEAQELDVDVKNTSMSPTNITPSQMPTPQRRRPAQEDTEEHVGKHAHGGLENTDAPTTLQHLQNTAPDDVVAERVSDPLVIGLEAQELDVDVKNTSMSPTNITPSQMPTPQRRRPAQEDTEEHVGKHAHGGLENTDAPTTLQHLQNTAPDDVVAERVSDPLVIGLEAQELDVDVKNTSMSPTNITPSQMPTPQRRRPAQEDTEEHVGKHAHGGLENTDAPTTLQHLQNTAPDDVVAERVSDPLVIGLEAQELDVDVKNTSMSPTNITPSQMPTPQRRRPAQEDTEEHVGKHAHGGLENTDAPTTLQHLQNTAPDDVVAERVSDPLVIGLEAQELDVDVKNTSMSPTNITPSQMPTPQRRRPAQEDTEEHVGKVVLSRSNHGDEELYRGRYETFTASMYRSRHAARQPSAFPGTEVGPRHRQFMRDQRKMRYFTQFYIEPNEEEPEYHKMLGVLAWIFLVILFYFFVKLLCQN